MGEVSLQTLPKNIMIQDMISSENSMNTTESTNTNTFKNVEQVDPNFRLHQVTLYVQM